MDDKAKNDVLDHGKVQAVSSPEAIIVSMAALAFAAMGAYSFLLLMAGAERFSAMFSGVGMVLALLALRAPSTRGWRIFAIGVAGFAGAAFVLAISFILHLI